MLNDIKFLYYLLTNYTLKEIKTLFEIAHLIPKMILLQKYYENNTTRLRSSKMSSALRRVEVMEKSLKQQFFSVNPMDTEKLCDLARRMELVQDIKKFLEETQLLNEDFFVMGNRENPETYVSDKNRKDERVIVSSGTLSQWLSDEPPELPEGKELLLTAGATEDERISNANKVMDATGITVGVVYPYEELDWILGSVSNLSPNIRIVIAFGGSTIHMARVSFTKTGMAVSDPESYMSFPTDSEHRETSFFISQMILECAKGRGLVLITGSPTVGIPSETWDDFKPNQYGYFNHAQLRGFVKNLGERGRDVNQIFRLIYKKLSLPWEDSTTRAEGFS